MVLFSTSCFSTFRCGCSRSRPTAKNSNDKRTWHYDFRVLSRCTCSQAVTLDNYISCLPSDSIQIKLCVSVRVGRELQLSLLAIRKKGFGVRNFFFFAHKSNLLEKTVKSSTPTAKFSILGQFPLKSKLKNLLSVVFRKCKCKIDAIATSIYS